MSELDPIITIDDIRKAGYCVARTKDWFGAHDLDFRKFLREGIPAADLLATGDALAENVVNRKRDRGQER